ncbi:PASTA domain-containing protein [Fluviicola taffensis]|uniref:PASTA domain containing protein n=1 Tax=Fluviicola taffensis (strain DSM 16823 / NCIMB 13979 / RW262) TaxID=755732 RepID=F2I9C5_FLUTR|nr:PASTA domain-containing protein [Fluviicola taffensis]AEA44082.1 PASTA domain containing protein [Fluviicola taffensis DSM 16823]
MKFFQKLKAFVWSRHFLKHSIFILLTYIVVIGILVMYLDSYTNNGEKIDVPNIVGLNSQSGQAKLEALELKIEVLDSVYKPDVPAGTIVSQDPLPTSKSMVYVKSGRIIRVQVSKKSRLVEMPSLIDKSERIAESVLKNRGLKYRKTYVATNESNGAVLKQLYKGKEIKEGTKVPIGSVITLVVGQNDTAQPVEAIDLTGLTISEAKARLSGISLHLFVGVCNGCANAADTTTAVINSQSPEYIEGVMVSPGSTITVSADKK